VNLPIAARNLLRNRWRSGLTGGAVAVAVALIVWFVHMAAAMYGAMIASATDAEIGDAQIATAARIEDRSLYHAMKIADAQLDAIRRVEGVQGAAPRVEAFGLVGHERQSTVARVVGVDAALEPGITSIPGKVTLGAWLSDTPEAPPAPREVVLGKTLAEHLEVTVGDELVIFTTAANGALGNDALKIVGIAATGNSNLDRMAVWMHIADVQWLTALEGKAHEIILAAEPGADMEAIKTDVAAVLGGEGPDKLMVRAWYDIVPELAQMVEVSESSMWIFYIIIYLLAGLGLLNTQRMTALERRREFGVLLAIGTRPGRLRNQVIAETVMLTTMGAAVGTTIGMLISWYHQVFGLDFSASSPDGEAKPLEYMGVTFERFYFHLDPGSVVLPVLLIVFVGLLCGLWPAIQSGRLDITRAISGRT
jgi:ABC-type lipoprotein release transport system permease subunit